MTSCQFARQRTSSIRSTSGLEYEQLQISAVTEGGCDGVVYYLIDISTNDHHQSYTIRRRYREFKKLHRQLAHLGLADPQHSQQDEEQVETKQRTSSFFNFFSGFDAESNCSTPPYQPEEEPELPYHPNRSVSAQLPLPEMPDTGGLFSMFTPKKKLLANRMRQFNKLLKAAVSHSNQRQVQTILTEFIKEAPGDKSAYVSLHEYAAPDLSLSEERVATLRRRHQRHSQSCNTPKKSHFVPLPQSNTEPSSGNQIRKCHTQSF